MYADVQHGHREHFTLVSMTTPLYAICLPINFRSYILENHNSQSEKTMTMNNYYATFGFGKIGYTDASMTVNCSPVIIGINVG